MPYVTTEDGCNLYYEETGSGAPIVFVHEFAGDHRSWEPQVRYFSRLYRCITFAARGYKPSDVPESLDQYSQGHAVDDIVAVIDGLNLQAAHVVGLSMGGYAALHLAIRHPNVMLSAVIAGCGYGSEASRREGFQQFSGRIADLFEAQGSTVAAPVYANVPERTPYLRKDTRGSALTLRGIQMRRPSVWELIDDMRAITTPTLIISGDDDDPCLEPSLLLKRNIPGSGLLVLPRSGHAMNLEEPDAFNRAIGDFLHTVECGRW